MTTPTPPVVDNPGEIPPSVVEKALFPEEQSMGPFAYSLFLEEKLRQARDLIKWFSLRWGADHDPLFPWRDPVTHADLPENRRLQDTWYEVVRGGVVCESCEGTGGTRISADQDRVFTFEACSACQGPGYFVTSSGDDPQEQGPGDEPPVTN